MEGLTFTKKNPEEGEETIASCSWTGSPDPEVTWFKDDSPLVETDLPSRMRITAGREGDTLSSSLEIDAVELSDTGQYTCNVSNPVKHISRVNRLEVRGSYTQSLLQSLTLPIIYSKTNGRNNRYFQRRGCEW